MGWVMNPILFDSKKELGNWKINLKIMKFPVYKSNNQYYNSFIN
jgi:hypothetical protein